MRYLHHVVAELVAVLAVQVRLRNSRMANSYGLWRDSPRGGELLHSTFPKPCSSGVRRAGEVPVLQPRQEACVSIADFNITFLQVRIVHPPQDTRSGCPGVGAKRCRRCCLSAWRGRGSSRRYALCFSHYERSSLYRPMPSFSAGEAALLPALTLGSALAR
jgi:hypothetical protein